ncbi:hypothetical protein [Polyangium mundeleinium]|uniref:Uncharacterized protein n=1 Tax=Polyangium mundeleinium TaxID=2995306 RepID=A0ABT5EGV2_9BACT|nr:hypothetical protein [Polyangium mundeleinium]MDC0740709.1 hypothetical protein [Polyangium mundeleinium]
MQNIFALAQLLSASATCTDTELRALCDAVEVFLARALERDPMWPRHDWLDGFIASIVERYPGYLLLRGEVWVSAVRTEPCEVEIQPGEQCLTIRFMAADGPQRRRLPPVSWLYVFEERGK